MTRGDARLIDLRHLGRERVIGCWVLDDVLVDPGPESCSAELLRHLDEPPRAILLTHIHLDHAAAAGALARHWPEATVFVHERGAPHLAAPSRLLASARRLYGADMHRLWGRIVPVPEEQIRPLAGGEALPGGVRCAATPGHASHHLSFLHEATGWAFTGDVAGVRIPPASHVLMPTPPPDVDVVAWGGSLRAVAEWRPEALGLTHFGAVADVDAHLAAAEEGLAAFAGRAAALSAAEFLAAVRRELEAAAPAETVAAYAQAAPLDHHYLGLRRFLDRAAAPI
jgi:glyoxylase-like metal-dependent hydrolase (beta-lactamase superfamily II)